MKYSLKHLSVPIVVLPVLFALFGCVREAYVNQEIGTLKPAIKEATDSSKQAAERIDGVDKQTQQAVAAAQAADQKATQAGTTAQAAQQTAQGADRKGDAATQGVQQAGNRITTLEGRIAKLGDNYAESGKTTIMFSSNSTVLSKDAETILDKFLESTSGLKTGYMVEIQGFTDSAGSESYNISLSSSRANSVQRYLISKGVPLYRISVLGLGNENPVGDNKTKTGRDQNRRVEVILLKKA